MATRIHVLSAHETNHPWGFENRLIPALARAGYDVIATDYRKHRGALARLIATPCELVVVCKGEMIAPGVIAAAPAPTVLWYAEQIGTLSHTDDAAEQRRRELALNVAAFDLVFSHDASNLDVYRTLGARDVRWLPTACADPGINRPIHAAKIHDATFAGTLTARRRRLLERLATRIDVHVTTEHDPERLNAVVNASRIVLNLHLSDLPNTETRVGEVLGAGTCLVTESLSSPGLLEDGVHAAGVPTGDAEALAATVATLLETPARRASIGAAGHAYILADHTIDHRARALANAGLALRTAA